MNRRTALRTVVVISAGATLLPSCRNSEHAGLPLRHLSLSGSQQDMVADLSGTILPKTGDFSGAVDLKCHEFVLTMIDDCNGPEVQKQFTDGMNAF